MNWQDYLREQYTAATADVYGLEIRRYPASCPGAGTAVYKDILAYIGALRSHYLNASTLNRILCSIKAYYDYLCASGQRPDNPAASIGLRDPRSRDIQLQDLFSMEELEVLLNRKERYGNLASRNKVLTSLLIYQALHPVEMEALRVNAVDLQAGRIRAGVVSKAQPGVIILRVYPGDTAPVAEWGSQ